jgi:HEAT repeat protein
LKLSLLILLISSFAFSSVDTNRYQTLKRKAFSDSFDMSERWKSIIEMSQIQHKDRLPDLKKALKSQTWFVRNAALLALEKMDANLAEPEAIKLLSDPALVVRSAAVEVLAKRIKSSAVARKSLWEELNDKQNIIQKESLWIRPQIIQHLAKFPVPADQSLFKAMLTDSSAQVQEIARNALAQIPVK